MDMIEKIMNTVFGTRTLYGQVSLMNKEWNLRIKVEGTDLNLDAEVYHGMDATILHVVTVTPKKECITDAFVENVDGVVFNWKHARLVRSTFHPENTTHESCLEFVVEVEVY